jgi:hypothetical protein
MGLSRRPTMTAQRQNATGALASIRIAPIRTSCQRFDLQNYARCGGSGNILVLVSILWCAYAKGMADRASTTLPSSSSIDAGLMTVQGILQGPVGMPAWVMTAMSGVVVFQEKAGC